MFENNYLPLLMFCSIIFVALIGISPCLNVALVGIMFGFFFVGPDIFLKIPSQIYDTLYNLNWLSVPLAIFFSCLARNLISTEEILTLWKTTKKQFHAIIVFFSLLPINSIFTGLIGGTGTITNNRDSVFLKKINSWKIDLDFIKTSQLVSVSLIPPSLALIVLVNATGVDLPSFFSAIIFPAFVYALFCQIYFFWKANNAFLELNKTVLRVQTEKKLLFLKLATPYLFLIFFIISIISGLLSITGTLCVGILSISILLVFNKKKQCKSIFISSYKQTGTLCAVIFFSYICAQFFLETFRTLGGEDLILTQIITLSEDVNLKLVSILIVLFLLQFLFTWLEISFILVPLLLPVISFLNIDLIWFLVLVCFSFHNLAFFTPFGLNSTSLIGKSKNLTVSSYFKNYLPFLCIQIVVLSVVFFNSAFFTIGT